MNVDDLTEIRLERILRDRAAARRTEELRYQGALYNLEIIIDRETEENGGINADHPAIERQRAERHARMIRNDQRLNMARQGLGRRGRQYIVAQDDVVNNVVPPLAGELAQLAANRQNVHTAIVVAKVKETVQTILKIYVPPEYETDTLKTPGEIILECNLSKQGAWQMMTKYCNDGDIYEMGAGIYARVLNSVWQYIKSSDDSPDLKKILRAEMEDNIGMCAQGNLSRICNILSGYLDGINADVKSRNEILGERFAQLLNLNEGREEAGRAILEELDIPPNEWNHWLETL